MNEQLHPIYGGLVALAMVVTFLYYFLQAMESGDGQCSLDNFTIGYIVENNPNVVHATVKFEEDNFFNDCKDALVAIGYKKSKAKSVAKKIFTNSQPTDIQSFLKEALSSEEK